MCHRQYKSQTLVLIEQQKVPDDYVKPVITQNLDARLASMKEQITSRSRLLPIVEHYNLYGTKRMSMDDRIDLVRKDIDIQLIRSQVTNMSGLPGFYITFKAGDARTAQLVCGEIESLFLNEDAKTREQTLQGTTDFLKGQLADAKRNLDEQDAKLAEFQRQYSGKLPGEESPNMNMLTSLNTQLQASTQALAQLQQSKSYNESILSAASIREVPINSDQPRAQPEAQQLQLQQLLKDEADLSAHGYTDEYPDVVTVRRKIKELRAEMAKPQPAPIYATAKRTKGSGVDEPGATASAAPRNRPVDRTEGARTGTDPGAGATVSGPDIVKPNGAGAVQDPDARLPDGAGLL